MTANTLTPFCLISGEPASSAFSVKVNPNTTVDDLKDAIVSKMPNAFKHIDASDLLLWRATIPIEEEEGITTLDGMDNKTKLGNPRACLSKLFPESPNDNTYIVVERPQVTSTSHTLELEAKVKELLMEIEDLRGANHHTQHRRAT
ncbi:hypothetical protein BGZ73_003445 [Actinomortierella ambigua]|nr:hypothetical protein BGZ73_003445 [Actinomortierella ambigua]